MLGFRPKPPLTDEQSSWVDDGFERLGQILGRNRMIDAQVVLPIVEHFPDPYDGTERSLDTLFRRVCGYMKFEADRVELEVRTDRDAEIREKVPFWQGKSSQPAGLYSRSSLDSQFVIAIRDSLLRNPLAVVATLAHELVHTILLGEALIDRSMEDMEPFTDLTTVYLGFGVFSANASLRFEQHQDYSTQGWSVQTLGYLSQEVYGHALAKFATERGEVRPEWAQQLSTNVRSYFKRSHKWLRNRQNRSDAV